ncbi:MAG: TonB-dependent receptor [Halioglobus sp.]
MFKFHKSRLAHGLLVAAAAPLLATSLPGQAQDESASRLEEVIVTARKRSESLQDVPVAVSALTPSQIEQSGIQSMVDVSKLVPNVELHMVSQSGASLGASIRGIGFDDLEKTFEPTVGIAVDGVFMASNSGAVLDFFDVEAIEVLRGPQGTLYGRNTIGGVVSVTRTQPTGEFGMKLEGTFADNDRQDLKGILNTPLGENGGFKLSYRDLEQDSHLKNITNNETPANRDSQVWGAAVRYDFTEKFTATLAYDDYDHQTQPPDVIATGTNDSVFCGNFGLACNADSGAISKDSGYTKSVASEQILAYIEGENITLNAAYSGDNFTVKYIFGNMDFEELASFNSWGAPTPLFEVLREQTYEQTSHELQYLSNYDGPLNFVAGLYYLETDSFITSGPVSNFTTTQDAEAVAVFGEINYEFAELWTFTVGARYTEEEKELNSQTFTGPDKETLNPGFPLTPEYDDDNLSYRFILQRDIGDIGMVYGSFSTGYRSGGFNNRGSDETTIGPYESEEVDSWELGIRTQPTDNLQLNVTAFFSEYSDKQQFVVTDGSQCGISSDQTCTFVRNAAETTNQGLEIEAVYLPTDNLTFRATYGYLDAEFDEYDFNGRDISDDAPIIYAPENTASLTGEYEANILGGNLILTGTYSFTDEVFGNAGWESYSFETGPDITISSHSQLDFAATFFYPIGNGTAKLMVYGTDVTDSDGRVARAFDAGAFAWKELVPGRQLGVTVGYEF